HNIGTASTDPQQTVRCRASGRPAHGLRRQPDRSWEKGGQPRLDRRADSTGHQSENTARTRLENLAGAVSPVLPPPPAWWTGRARGQPDHSSPRDVKSGE